MKMLERKGAVVFATLTTPTGTVSEARQASIVAALEKRLGKKVFLSQAKDPSLLAGATLRVGDERFDISLAGDLTQILRS
jgi:F0F1-type ATP synthase delta subunit